MVAQILKRKFPTPIRLASIDWFFATIEEYFYTHLLFFKLLINTQEQLPNSKFDPTFSTSISRELIWYAWKEWDYEALEREHNLVTSHADGSTLWVSLGMERITNYEYWCSIENIIQIKPSFVNLL